MIIIGFPYLSSLEFPGLGSILNPYNGFSGLEACKLVLSCGICAKHPSQSVWCSNLSKKGVKSSCSLDKDG